jgi:hypothetical protein
MVKSLHIDLVLYAEQSPKKPLPKAFLFSFGFQVLEEQWKRKGVSDVRIRVTIFC